MLKPDTVSWDEFKSELEGRVGLIRTQIIFLEQTGYDRNTMQSWKARGLVPVEAFEKIAEIDLAAIDSERFKGYHTKRFFDRVVELSNADTPIRRIAQILTLEMDRKVTEGAVKSARFRNKDRITGYRTQGA